MFLGNFFGETTLFTDQDKKTIKERVLFFGQMGLTAASTVGGYDYNPSCLNQSQKGSELALFPSNVAFASTLLCLVGSATGFVLGCSQAIVDKVIDYYADKFQQVVSAACP